MTLMLRWDAVGDPLPPQETTDDIEMPYGCCEHCQHPKHPQFTGHPMGCFRCEMLWVLRCLAHEADQL